MPETLTRSGVLLIGTESLTDETIPTGAGAGGGNDLYDAKPGDGAGFDAAPNAAAEDTFSPAFEFSSFTVFVENSAGATTEGVEVRVSADDGGSWGDWIELPAGAGGALAVYDVPLAGTDVQIREQVDNGGATYQIVAFA